MSSRQESLESNISENESNWWENFVKDNYPTQECLKHLKCSRKTFFFLVKFLKPYIAPKLGTLDQDIYLRKGVCVEKQVAVLLVKLTTCADYVSISKKFKIHKTTIHKIIYKSVVALNKYLLRDVISMPKEEEADDIGKDFDCVYKVPQILGVMTIVHVPISSPINLNYKFLNSNLYPSFILQTVIDSNCFFRDVSVRHAGAAEPHTIVTDSNIYKYSKKVLPSVKRLVNGVEVSYKIVGPSAGPLYPWLLNNYGPAPNAGESLFNKHLDDVRSYADSVIARLRSRFLILSQMMDLSYKVAPQIIAACCIIHNVCEKNEDPLYEEWLMECIDLLKKYPQPEMLGEWEQPSEDVLEERDALKDYLCDQSIQVVPSQDILETALNQAMLDPM